MLPEIERGVAAVSEGDWTRKVAGPEVVRQAVDEFCGGLLPVGRGWGPRGSLDELALLPPGILIRSTLRAATVVASEEDG